MNLYMILLAIVLLYPDLYNHYNFKIYVEPIRLVVSQQDARKTMELMFQLWNEQHCDGLLQRYQQLKEIFI